MELLDTVGEGGLTVRALTTHLSTGRGAIYHHVAGMDDLLALATESIIGQVLAAAEVEDDPKRAIRAQAIGIWDAIDAHPWVGTQLSREPLQPAAFRIWASFGSQLQLLGLSGPALSDAGSALVNYVFGAAAQYAAGARHAPRDADRTRYLQALAAEWVRYDEAPMVQQAAATLQEHDDRAQFLAGVGIFLAGITSGL